LSFKKVLSHPPETCRRRRYRNRQRSLPDIVGTQKSGLKRNKTNNNYSIQAVVPSVAWEFLFDKHINLTYLAIPNHT
jgi:hypothetical protein